MTGFISYLNRHKIFTALTGSVYFVATVVFHKQIANLSLNIEKKLSFTTYNSILGFITLSLSLIVAGFLLNKIRTGGDKFYKLVFLAWTVSLLVVAHIAVLAVNVEYIHLLHYVFLTFFVFGLTLKFGETLFWITLMGTIDEVYQYYVVWPAQAYMDFNDIIYDLLGGAIGIILIYIFLNLETLLPKVKIPRRNGLKSPVILTGIVLVCAYLLLSFTGILEFAPQEDLPKAPIHLNRVPPPPEFWTVFEKGKTYHILKPLEWAVLVALLTFVYSLIDYRISKCSLEPSDIR